MMRLPRGVPRSDGLKRGVSLQITDGMKSFISQLFPTAYNILLYYRGRGVME